MNGGPEIAVIDTHVLIWWLTGQVRTLGRRARAFMERVDERQAVAYIPAIALVELSEAVQAGAVSLRIPFEALVTRLDVARSQYLLVPLTPAIVSRSHALFEIPERGDRLIAATALEEDLPLFTRDPEIGAVPGVRAIW